MRKRQSVNTDKLNLANQNITSVFFCKFHSLLGICKSTDNRIRK